MIALLHPGSMGAAVGAQLVNAGHRVGWLPAGRSDATHQRAVDAGLVAYPDLGSLLAAADIVLSICPPHAAVEVAESLAGFEGIVVDANAVAPSTSQRIAGIVASGSYVDGGIVGGPPREPDTTRLYLAGAAAAQIAELFAGTALATVVLGEVPAASALKMTYAAWTKGTAALLVSIRDTAAALGVEDALLAEWQHSLPQLPAESERATDRAVERGWRWAFELAEVGRTFAAAGQPAGFGAAAAEVFERAAGARAGARRGRGSGRAAGPV